MTGGADGVEVDLEQRGARLDLGAFLRQRGEAVALHLHGIHAHMDEQLDAVIAHQAHRVQAFGHLCDGAVKRCVNGIPGGFDAAAAAQNGRCERLVRQLLQRDDLACQRHHHRLLFALEFRLGCILAAEQLIKKAHIITLLSALHTARPSSE